MREGMHRLTEGIAGSFKARAGGIALLRKEVASQRQVARTHVLGLSYGRRSSSRQQRAELERGRAGLAQGDALRRSQVQGWLREVVTGRQSSSRQQRAELERGRADLAQGDALRRSQVQGWLREVAAARQSSSRQQQAELGRGRAGLAQADAQRRSQVQGWLREVVTGRQSSSRQQRAGLAQGDARRRSQVQGWLREVAADRQAAQAEWQQMADAIQASRAGGVVTLPLERPSPRSGEVLSEEEAIAKAEVGEITAELSTLQDRVSAYLAEHPDGTRLTELEGEFNLNRLQAARVVRSLINDGKAEKRDLLYFAI